MKKFRITKINKNDNVINIKDVKRQKKKKKRLKVVAILLVIAATITLLLSPLFNIKTITVENNKKVSDANVLSLSKIKVGENMFKINVKHSKNMIETIPYIKEAHIYRHLNANIEISVTERNAKFCFKKGTGYILSDEEGRFLEVVSNIPEKTPLITGLSIEKYKIGDFIESKFSDNLTALNELIYEFENLKILDRVSEINIKNANNLTFVFDSNKKIIMGENFRTDYKLMMLKATIEEIAPSEEGTIDLSDAGKALFTPSR